MRKDSSDSAIQVKNENDLYKHIYNLKDPGRALLACVEAGFDRDCIIMGDFNINLLKIDSHLGTDEFLDNLTSFNFSPHILQPTRITHHSATSSLTRLNIVL